MPFSTLHLNHMLLLPLNKLLVQFWLDIWSLFLTKLVELVSFGWFPGMGPAFKHSPQIFNTIGVEALRKPFQRLHVGLLYPFQSHFWCLFGIIVMLKPPVLSQFQLSTWWFEVKLKNLDLVLLFSLFHPLYAMYQYHWQENSPRA